MPKAVLNTRNNYEYIIGIDEAGRGPLAGPVAIGAVLLYPDFDTSRIKAIKNKDSKKLTHTEREFWFENIKLWQQEGKLSFHVALVSNTIIDTKGISHAIKKGMEECLDRLDADPEKCFVFLDGSLHAPKLFVQQETIIKGDEKVQVISLASIAAKVTRDRKMLELAKKYPDYKLDIHKGYGTALHRKLIKEHGPSKVHRQSFLGRIMGK